MSVNTLHKGDDDDNNNNNNNRHSVRDLMFLQQCRMYFLLGCEAASRGYLIPTFRNNGLTCHPPATLGDEAATFASKRGVWYPKVEWNYRIIFSEIFFCLQLLK